MHCSTAPAVGQKDIIQPLEEGKVSAHVAHRSLTEPQGIVNKVKAQEKNLNRGCKRALSVKTMVDQQEALSATVHMSSEAYSHFYSQTAAPPSPPLGQALLCKAAAL